MIHIKIIHFIWQWFYFYGQVVPQELTVQATYREIGRHLEE